MTEKRYMYQSVPIHVITRVVNLSFHGGWVAGQGHGLPFYTFFARCINICINKCATRISRKQQLAVFVMLIIHIANVKNSTLIDSTMYFYNDTISSMSNDILKIRMAVTGQAVDLTASWIRDIT